MHGATAERAARARAGLARRLNVASEARFVEAVAARRDDARVKLGEADGTIWLADAHTQEAHGISTGCALGLWVGAQRTFVAWCALLEIKLTRFRKAILCAKESRAF